MCLSLIHIQMCIRDSSILSADFIQTHEMCIRDRYYAYLCSTLHTFQDMKAQSTHCLLYITQKTLGILYNAQPMYQMCFISYFAGWIQIFYEISRHSIKCLILYFAGNIYTQLIINNRHMDNKIQKKNHSLFFYIFLCFYALVKRNLDEVF